MLSILFASLLLVPHGGDPTLQPPETNRAGIAAHILPPLFFGGNNVTAVTYAIWVRWNPAWKPESNIVPTLPIIEAMVSNESGRSTVEGGASLPDLLEGLFEVDPLPLVGGVWSSSCLLGRADLAPESTSGNWKYGCYCVNYKSDVGFTINVAGEERFCAPSDNGVFNIVAASTSRELSVVAENTSARINLGIAHNPLRQFCGAQSSQLDQITQSFDDNNGGISDAEWRMFAFRARLENGSVHCQIDMFRPMGKCANMPTADQVLWQPSSTFAANSSVRVNCSYCAGGLEIDGKKQVIRYYAPKGKERWMSDAELELWRDLDYAEIVRRGMNN